MATPPPASPFCGGVLVGLTLFTRALFREFVLPDRKAVLKGYAREVDWDARARRWQQEELGVEDDQQAQVCTWTCERVCVCFCFCFCFLGSFTFNT